MLHFVNKLMLKLHYISLKNCHKHNYVHDATEKQWSQLLWGRQISKVPACQNSQKLKFSTLIHIFTLLTFTLSPVLQGQWATLVWRGTSKKNDKNQHPISSFSLINGCSCCWLLLRNFTGFSSTLYLLDSFTIWMLHLTECDGAKPPASPQTWTTHSTQHQLPTTRPVRESMKVMVQLGKRVKII